MYAGTKNTSITNISTRRNNTMNISSSLSSSSNTSTTMMGSTFSKSSMMMNQQHHISGTSSSSKYFSNLKPIDIEHCRYLQCEISKISKICKGCITRTEAISKTEKILKQEFDIHREENPKIARLAYKISDECDAIKKNQQLLNEIVNMNMNMNMNTTSNNSNNNNIQHEDVNNVKNNELEFYKKKMVEMEHAMDTQHSSPNLWFNILKILQTMVQRSDMDLKHLLTCQRGLHKKKHLFNKQNETKKKSLLLLQQQHEMKRQREKEQQMNAYNGGRGSTTGGGSAEREEHMNNGGSSSMVAARMMSCSSNDGSGAAGGGMMMEINNTINDNIQQNNNNNKKKKLVNPVLKKFYDESNKLVLLMSKHAKCKKTLHSVKASSYVIKYENELADIRNKLGYQVNMIKNFNNGGIDSGFYGNDRIYQINNNKYVQEIMNHVSHIHEKHSADDIEILYDTMSISVDNLKKTINKEISMNKKQQNNDSINNNTTTNSNDNKIESANRTSGAHASAAGSGNINDEYYSQKMAEIDIKKNQLTKQSNKKQPLPSSFSGGSFLEFSAVPVMKAKIHMSRVGRR